MTSVKDMVKVEDSTDIAQVRKTMKIVGLEDVPVSIIPLPFYKLVQPGSTNVTMGDGTDAMPGTIFMGDGKTNVTKLHCAMLRVKHNRQVFTDPRTGEERVKFSYNMLGINVENFTPFILSIGLSSISNFGSLIKQIKDLNIKNAWERGITISSEKREEEKETAEGRKKVKYYVMNFSLDAEAFDASALAMLESAYEEFAGSLDRRNESETPAPAGDVKETATQGGDEIPF